MKGYKGSRNGKCMNKFHYEVGQTYTLNVKPKLCEQGFHFCLKPDDVLLYYAVNSEFVLFEVNAIGEVVHDRDEEKSCTNKIEIVRIIPKEEYNKIFKNYEFEFHENGAFKSAKNHLGFHYKYDDKGYHIWYKDPNECEYVYESGGGGKWIKVEKE
jgi:hypothetical protein